MKFFNCWNSFVLDAEVRVTNNTNAHLPILSPSTCYSGRLQKDTGYLYVFIAFSAEHQDAINSLPSPEPMRLLISLATVHRHFVDILLSCL